MNTKISEHKGRQLYSGTRIPIAINTDERIFQIETYNAEIILCNLETAQLLIKNQECKRIKHYWDFLFKTIGKKEVLEMPIN